MSEINEANPENNNLKAGTDGHERRVHPDAKVSAEADIGPGCSIGPRAEIGPDVKLGENCRIGPRVQLEGSIEIGKNNVVETGTMIAADKAGENYSSAGCEEDEKDAAVVIGDNNIIREYSLLGIERQVSCFEKAGESVGESRIIIGDNNFLMAYTVINPGVRLGSRIKIANASCLKPGVKVGDDTFVAGMVVAAENVEIGEMAMLGGHSHLQGDLPPYLLADGVPARVKTMNAVALRRNDVERETFREIKQIFKSLFREEDGLENNFKQLCSQNWKSDKALKLINFISDRDNLCRGCNEE